MKNRKGYEKQESTRKTGKDMKNRKGYEKQERIRTGNNKKTFGNVIDMCESVTSPAI